VHGRSDLLGAVAVGVGDYFHQVTVGVVKIDAATTVQMIDFAGPCAPRMGVVPDALSADSGERRVEFRVRRGKWSKSLGAIRGARLQFARWPDEQVWELIEAPGNS